MQDELTPKEHESLSASLDHLLKDHEEDSISLSTILATMGDKSFGLLLMLLSLPSALPVPATGYSTPFGIIMMILGFQMLLGKHIPWIPQFAFKKSIGKGLVQKMVSAADWFLKKIEHLIKPRLSLFCGKGGHVFLGGLVIIMAFLMALPIPLTNTAPAMVIFLIGIALSEEDGLLALLAMIISIAAIGLYTFVLYIFFKYGIDGVLQLKEALKNWLVGLT